MKKARNESVDLSLPETASPYYLDRLKRTLASEIHNAEISGNNWILPSLQYLDSTYLLKYVDENTAPAQERKLRAIVKWLAVERHNLRVNRRLAQDQASQIVFTLNKSVKDSKSVQYVRLDQLFSYARWNIRKVLGYAPPEGLIHQGSFSGGASTSVKRQPGAHAVKFTDGMDVTVTAFAGCISIPCMAETWETILDLTGKNQIRLRKGNVLFTVPKTAEIDRVAAKEPSLNMYAQKACGDFIRRRLKHFGIDLDDQSPNGEAAGRHPSKVATIDLSSASDTLCRELVRELLPHDWFELLNNLRSHYTLVEGTWHLNQMFSSMGNGFTFELESLVFWALAQATSHVLDGLVKQDREPVSGRTVLVYGDDIVVDRNVAGPLINVLRSCGFIVNTKKSHWTAADPVRESCGRHYHQGSEVTPFYIRAPLKDVSDMILQLNLLRAWIIRVGADIPNQYGRTPFVSLWKDMAEKFVPRPLWGGHDTGVRTQLASPHAPRLEIVDVRKPLKRRTEALQEGLYLSVLRQLELKSSARLGKPSRKSTVLPGILAEEELSSPLSLVDTSKALSAEQTVDLQDALIVESGSAFHQLNFSESAPYLLPPKGRLSVRKLKWRPAVFGLTCPLFLSEQ